MKRDDDAGQHVPAAGRAQQGQAEGRQQRPPAGLGDDGLGPLEHDDLAPGSGRGLGGCQALLVSAAG